MATPRYNLAGASGDQNRTGQTSLQLGLQGSTLGDRYGAGWMTSGGAHPELGYYAHGMGSGHRDQLEDMLRRGIGTQYAPGFSGSLTEQDFLDLTMSGGRRSIEAADPATAAARANAYSGGPITYGPDGTANIPAGWSQTGAPAYSTAPRAATGGASMAGGPMAGSPPPMGGMAGAMAGGGGSGASAPGGVGAGFGAFHDPLARLVGGQYLQGNPHLQTQIDAAKRGLDQSWRESVLPGISRSAEAAGRFGGDAWAGALGRAGEGYAGAVGDLEGGMRFQDYNARMADLVQGLGLGTSRDIAQLQDARQGQNSADDLAYRREALQQSGELDQLNMLMSMAGLQSGDINSALGMLPGLDAMSGMGAWGGLFDQSLGLGGLESQYDLAGRQLRQQGQLANRGFGLQEQAQRYQQERDALDWFNQDPWSQLGQYGQLVSGLTSPYAGSSTRGVGQPRGYTGPDPTSAGISGALSGMQLMGLLGGGGGGGGGTNFANNPAGRYWAGNPW